MTNATPYLLKYFQVEKPWDINMVHGVNDKERFVKYVSDPSVHMFEVDIEDYGGKVGDIVLQHEKVGDVQLIWAIKQLLKHKKALKLDIKVPKGNPYRSEFYKYALDVMREHWDPEIPIWINADVLNGPNWENSNHVVADPEDFIQLYNSYYSDNPNTMISLGYLTKYNANAPVTPYTTQMFDEMQHVVESVEGLTTVSLRYCNLMEDQSVLPEFLKLGSVTIWNRGNRISDNQFNHLTKQVPSLNVFKDLTGLKGDPMWGERVG